jgi:uncharacterized lipoprotein YbaY
MSATATGVVVGKNGCEADTFNDNETITVSVQNTALMDASSVTLGEQKIALKKGDKFPINFSVQYDKEAASKVPEYGFTISARITDVNDKLLYWTDTSTSAKSDKIEVVKVRSFN